MQDQNKNLILATVLSFVVILVWTIFFAPPPPPTTDLASISTTPAAGTATSATTTSPTATDTTPGTTPGTGATADAAVVGAARIKIDSPRLQGSISLAGGRIDDLLLKDYHLTIEPGSPLVQLLAPVGGTDLNAPKPYYAVYGWSPAGGLDPASVPGPSTIWQAEAGDTLAPGKPVTIRWDSGKGLVFHRTYTIDDNYMFTVTQSVENNTGAPVRLSPYGIIARHGQPDGHHTYVLHEGTVRMSDGKLEETTYKKMQGLDQLPGEGPAEKIDVTANGWTAITDKYWMTALVPMPGQPFTSVTKYVPGQDIYQTETRLPVLDVAPGARVESANMLFAGAKEWETINHYQNNPGFIDRLLGHKVDAARPQILGFDDSIDWGWFFFFTKPMFRLLHWLHGAIGNMGLAIIALTFVIKLLVFPLARKSYISMAKMKELQPEMEKLKEAAGDDRMKMQKGMMELYKREKVNPASGCLPVVIQIPIFFSLYKVIVVTIELYHQPFFGWIKDLSSPDPSSILNLFGLLPYATPDVTSPLHIVSLGILPILLGISMWFQQKLNPAPTDATQAQIFAWMPWIFMFMLGSFASGLVLYWITNNTITFAQQYTIMSMHHKRPDIFGNIRSGFNRKKPAAKPK